MQPPRRARVTTDVEQRWQDILSAEIRPKERFVGNSMHDFVQTLLLSAPFQAAEKIMKSAFSEPIITLFS